ncbi:MAG: hypothetical protein JSS53_06745, partial [Proteobacteria bacterium]|nr:hypothetical protein [Pseudomonadota bacterium]
CYRKALYWIIVNSDAFLKRDMLLEKHHGTWRELLPLIDPESLSSDELPEVLISMPDEVVYAKLQELVEFFNTNATEYKESKKFELVLWSKIPQELRKKAMRKGERLYNSKKAHRQAFKSLIDETVRDHVKRAGLSDSKDIDTFTKASYAHVMEEFPVVARYAEKNRFHFVCFVGTEDPAWRAVKEDMVHGPYYFNLVQAEIKQVKSVQYERESSAQLPKENSKGSEKQQTKSDRKDEGKKEPTVLVQHPNIKFSIPLYTGEEYGRGKSSCRSCVGGASYLNPEKRCFTKASRVDYSHSGG